MKAVHGLERPGLQWLFVTLGVLLVVIVAGEAVALRRLHATLEGLRAADLNGRLDRERLERRVAQEQSARESFALDAARQRGAATTTAPEPTLTLAPVTLRRSTPPEPTVAAPPPAQSIQLRLVIAGRRADPSRLYAASMRSWSGGEVRWFRGGLRAADVDGRPTVVARLTGDVLAPGPYEVLLTDVSAPNAPIEAAAYEVSVGKAPPP